MDSNKQQKQYNAAIFDMDGTILDTLEDLRDALNHSLTEFGFRGEFTADETRPFFGSGAWAAVERALTAAGGAPEEVVEEVLAFYKPWYASHCDIKTRPYPGVIELIRTLKDAGVKVAVVSNKPDPAVQSLCRDYFPDLFDYAVGEKEGVKRKPSPDMVRSALAELGVPAEQAVYIGDSEVDIQTAQNAGLDCICVDWGFRTKKDLVRSGAKRIVSSCDEMLSKLFLL